jgi:hypothetical protein
LQQRGSVDPERSHRGGGGLNLYQFNNNNPVMYTDPFGLRTCPPDCGAIYAVAGTAFGAVGAVAGGIVGTAGGPAGIVVGAVLGGASGFGAGVAAGNVGEAVGEAGAEIVERGMTKLEKAFVTVMTAFGLTQEQKVKPPQEQKPLPPPPPIEQTTGPWRESKT